MRLSKSALVCLSMVAATLVAQEKPGTVAALEFQQPKNGMTTQYEEGRKRKAAWHKQQKDTQPLFVWKIVAGEGFGSYVVGRIGNHWKDFDAPSVPEVADDAAYEKNVGPYVQSVVARYYDYLPNISRSPASKEPPAMSQIVVYRVRWGQAGEFINLVGKINDAIKKTNWPAQYSWYTLVAGGPSPTFVLSLARNNWAEFGGPERPFAKMLEEAYGKQEAGEILGGLQRVIEGEQTEIVKFRPDLSYIPGK